MHRHFDQELGTLRENLLTMGALVESMITQAARLLDQYNTDAALQIEANEREVNILHSSIDDACVRLLVLRQPAAADMRLIAAALKINGELERIGDQAINILQRAQQLDKPGEWPRIELGSLIHTASGMVMAALDAFVKKDVPLARRVLEDEKAADSLRDQAVDVLLAKAEERTFSFAHIMQLILVTHHLERVADHATNIAEDVIYFVQGLDIRHHRME
jgi:phosphate transport system protein